MKGNNYRSYTYFEKTTSIQVEKLADLTNELQKDCIIKYAETGRNHFPHQTGDLTLTIADIRHTGISLSEITHLAE